MQISFSNGDRSDQIHIIREAIAEFRNQGASDPAHFQMHQLYDELLRQLADHFVAPWKGEMAVLGQGGYGRMEMCPYSDIDLLFLNVDDAAQETEEGIMGMLYTLWDAKIEVGYSVRTVDQCELEAGRDLAVLTSLMDTRLIWGDEEIFARLQERRERLIQDTDPLELYLRIEAEIRKSNEDFGDTIYLLEPNLKEGPGSLRYIQLVTWLSRMLFGCESLDDLARVGVCEPAAVEEVKEGVRFLAEVRTRLHFMSDRRDDRLSLQAQSAMARDMGYFDAVERISAVSFMREYYRYVAAMDFLGRQVRANARLHLRPKVGPDIKRLKLNGPFYMGGGGLNHESPEKFGRDPLDFLLAFRLVAETGCDLDIRLVQQCLKRIESIDVMFVSSLEANKQFLKILREGRYVAKVLNIMMKIGFLERFIVEFKIARFLPSHAAVHLYTVDLHTMKLLEYIDCLRRPYGSPEDLFLRTIASRIDKPEVLYLAALFHDVGKSQGAGHEVVGERIARPVLVRLGLPKEDVEDVCFLIRNHLAMPHLAFKKDLHDTAMLERFAETVMHQRRLDLLMILTNADLKGTGPSAFNSWKRMLLEELYYRTLDVIQGESPGGEDLGDWLAEIRSVVRKLVPFEHQGHRFERFLEMVPSRYLMDFYPGLIAEHYMSLKSYLEKEGKKTLGTKDLIASKVDHPLPGYSSITLLLRDRPGLFFKIAGTMAANRINILSAWSHTLGDDIGVATLHVNDIPEGPLTDLDRWDKFREDFGKVLAGEIDVHELVATKRRFGGRYRFAQRIPGPAHFVKVDIDNAASDRATIIEVSARDRTGLLYDITRFISSVGLNIILTKISTQANLATDIFYVQNEEDSKILDFERLDEIRTGLRDHLKRTEESLLGDSTNESVETEF